MTVETVLALALAFSPSPQPAPVVKYATVTKNVVSTRAATGQHTHTCPNNSCPIYKEFGVRETWDHAANSGHTCPFCNTEQRVQDTVKRPVTILRTVQVKVPDSPPIPPTVPAPRAVTATVSAFVLPQASSACANGQCSTVQSRRLFR